MTDGFRGRVAILGREIGVASLNAIFLMSWLGIQWLVHRMTRGLEPDGRIEMVEWVGIRVFIALSTLIPLLGYCVPDAVRMGRGLWAALRHRGSCPWCPIGVPRSNAKR